MEETLVQIRALAAEAAFLGRLFLYLNKASPKRQQNMGGRGSSSMTATMTSNGSAAVASAESASTEDYSRGEKIATLCGVSKERGAEMYDAIQAWAKGSSRIKNAQRGTGDFNEQDAANAEILDEFISKSPSYQGELVRVMSVPTSAKYAKNGKIVSDGSITSWTVPSNIDNAMNGFGNLEAAADGRKQTVILHVNATQGADIRKVSQLAALDNEILQPKGYDASLTIAKVKTETYKNPFFPEGVKVKHVYVKE